jgi:hypothetical protein
MKLQLLRINSGVDATSGVLFQVHPEGDKTFLCYTLEDQPQETKVMHETRIPAGTYDIKFRAVGGFHTRYLKRYGAGFHKGMLELQDVPGFKYILIHSGNTDEHTSGCILVGDTQVNNDKQRDGFIGQSRDAYKRIYQIIRDALLGGASVEIEIIDYEEGQLPSQEDTTTQDIKPVVGGLYCNKCNKKFKTQII